MRDYKTVLQRSAKKGLHDPVHMVHLTMAIFDVRARRKKALWQVGWGRCTWLRNPFAYLAQVVGL